MNISEKRFFILNVIIVIENAKRAHSLQLNAGFSERNIINEKLQIILILFYLGKTEKSILKRII